MRFVDWEQSMASKRREMETPLIFREASSWMEFLFAHYITKLCKNATWATTILHN
jgi:hypothetical protein